MYPLKMKPKAGTKCFPVHWRRKLRTCRRVGRSSSPHRCWRKGIRLHRSWSSWRGSGSCRTCLPPRCPPADQQSHVLPLSQLTLTLRLSAPENWGLNTTPPSPPSFLIPAFPKEKRLLRPWTPPHLKVTFLKYRCCD